MREAGVARLRLVGAGWEAATVRVCVGKVPVVPSTQNRLHVCRRKLGRSRGALAGLQPNGGDEEVPWVGGAVQWRCCTTPMAPPTTTTARYVYLGQPLLLTAAAQYSDPWWLCKG